jgi:serine/threonine protein kinase
VGPSKSSLVLLPNDYVTSGGEGSIYVKGKTVYKIMDPSRPKPYLEEKVKLLSQIRHRAIVSPQDVLYDKKDEVVGYTMPLVSGEALVRYFTNDFRKQQHYGDKETLQAVHLMKEINEVAHTAQALIVDGNEMNYLASKNGDVCIIDVDSWQIAQFKASAIMASIRDYHSKDFSEITDWFSWAIVTFQLFTGIHPYKGRHPNYKPGSFLERMKDNVSVFDKDVILPAAVRPLAEIPPNLAAWYEATFQAGKRELPPDNFDIVAAPKVIQKTVYKSTGPLRFTKLREFPENILRVFANGAILTEEELYLRGATHGIRVDPLLIRDCINTEVGTIVATDDLGHVIVAEKAGKDQFIEVPLSYYRMFSAGNRLFAVTDDGITELKFRKYEKVLCIPGQTWMLNRRSTRFEEGVAIYDALGAHFLMLPYEEDVCHQWLLEPLKDRTLISAKAIDNFVTCLVKEKSGQNLKVEVMIPGATSSNGNINLWTGQTDEDELNFTMNQHGIVTTIVNDGELVLFSPRNGKSQVIKDRHVTTDLKLVRNNGNIAFTKDNELWSLSTT